jgi:multiple sugar transport system ATP-binding protein
MRHDVRRPGVAGREVDVPELVLDGVWRVHDDGTTAVAGVHLRVGPGEIVTLIGPSGSGKTTLVRLVAGLEPLREGDVLVDGQPISRLRPRERDVAMVTQHGSLHPRRSAGDSIADPLRLRRLPPDELDARVKAETRVLRLERLLERRPGTLSAGERRLAEVARATVRVPKAFLLDNPLGDLDARERARVRSELATLVRGLGAPTLWVTGDRDEAMAVGDRVAVMRAGRLEQVGEPRALYERPAGLFVATFVGPAGLLPVRPEADATTSWLAVGRGGDVERLPLPGGPGRGLRGLLGRELIAMARPEHVSPAGEGHAGPRLSARVVELELHGSETLARCALDLPVVAVPGESPSGQGAAVELLARFPAFTRLAQGERVQLSVEAARLSLFDPATGAAVWHPEPEP